MVKIPYSPGHLKQTLTCLIRTTPPMLLKRTTIHLGRATGIMRLIQTSARLNCLLSVCGPRQENESGNWLELRLFQEGREEIDEEKEEGVESEFRIR